MLNLLAIQWSVDPDAFVLGPFHIRYYGLMFIIAFALGFYVFWQITRREREGILYIHLLNIVFLSSFIGARLGDCLFYYPDYYLKNPVEIFLPFANGKFAGFQGLSSHGAAFGLLIGIYIFARNAKLSYFWLLDRMVIVVALAGFFIRLGNLMNSEIYGTPTNLPWGVVFTQKGETVPRHPAQVYEALANLSVFFCLLWTYLKYKTKLITGILLGLFLTLVFTARFFIEYVKISQPTSDFNLGLNIGQILSLPFIFLGALIIMVVVMRGDLKRNIVTADEECNL